MTHMITEVWAQLFLSKESSDRIHDFLVSECGIPKKAIVRNMHITVYYARRPMPGVKKLREPASVVLPASMTKFMVMAPGGENPRDDLEPAKRKIGIRIERKNPAFQDIQQYRSRLLEYETADILGGRSPSNHKSNAFGARSFQPHMTLLYPGSQIDRELGLIGEPFRENIGDLLLDEFVVDITKKEKESE